MQCSISDDIDAMWQDYSLDYRFQRARTFRCACRLASAIFIASHRRFRHLSCFTLYLRAPTSKCAPGALRAARASDFTLPPRGVAAAFPFQHAEKVP